ncbi:ABC transporter substrate-binding protein [Parablautia muri]|uniref:Extracellular solute-binding protein n=1 Tax=Parablautia muri TaxID=2320879 RepID=A0A9X5BIR0_9FIRM|nr:extracellular solute-binding protein [Parablautia muri]NBJ94382.1 extracellular solute-binding protein [Parablautia muri]
MKKKLAMALCVALTMTALSGCGSSSGGNGASETSGSDSQQEAPVQEESEDASGEEAQSSDGGAQASGDVMTLEFFQQKSEEGPQKGYQAIIDKFNAENTDVQIEMNTVPDAGTVLTSRISSGDIPVIFSDYPTQVQFRQKVANGYVQDLSDQEFLKNVNEAALEMTKQEDGGYYALPYSRNYMGVYYNQTIFEENSVEIPTTWDEFVQVCETLKAAGITPMGLMGKDPGRVGHTFQCQTVAWSPNGIENIAKVAAGEGQIEGDAEFTEEFEKMKTLLSYSNEDALALSDTQCWENFANGQYAMCITGSYARGTIASLNPDAKLGVFPLPNDTVESTRTLAGIDAAICVSAKASDEEKAAAYRFLAYLAEPENAQLFCDSDGAPSCITGVVNDDEGIAPMIEILNDGRVHDWMASTINNNVVTDLYNVVQGFWAEQDVEKVLKDMDASIAVTSAE